MDGAHTSVDPDGLMEFSVVFTDRSLNHMSKAFQGVMTDISGMLKEVYNEEDSKSWVKKFFQLWTRNQWKRERYAPSFHFDDFNIDPRSWYRFPILSGGYQEELEAF